MPEPRYILLNWSPGLGGHFHGRAELLLRHLVQQRRFYTRDGVIVGGVHQEK